MTVVRLDKSGPVELVPEPFRSERELEDLVVSTPGLLVAADEPPLALVSRQVTLPESGTLDILLVNGEGLPVVAEAKLGRNAQSRREIIGQVVDYVSALTSFTVDELNHLVEGRIEVALRSFPEGADDDQRLEALWAEVGKNLRAGLARYVILVDEVPRELERIVRFLCLRSNLDLSLVCIRKYTDTLGETVVVPQHVVRSAMVQQEVDGGSSRQIPRELQVVIEAYEARAATGYETRGRGHSYRQIHPPGWPGSLHYEFLKYRDGISAEIHVESDSVSHIAEVLSPFAGPPRPGIPVDLVWDRKWSRNRGRLFARLPVATEPEVVAEAMAKLIELTHDAVAQKLGTREA